MIDLHIHTVYSDGDKTLEEILQMCEEKKLEYISITDHNTCGAYYDKALENNKTFNGTIITGCELNAEFQNKSIEILGYNLNPEIIMNWKKQYYSIEQINKNTKKIYDRFLSILDKKGITYNKKNIRTQKNEKEYIERPIWEEVIKYPENKKIIGKDCFNSLGIFFRKELTNPNSEYFLNRVGTFPNVKEVVNIIHEAGGKAFLAHPFEYQLENTIKFIDDLRKETNLDGIECFHPSSADDNKEEQLINYAKENGMYISGGSDYHGKLKPDIQIGIGKGNLNISKSYIENWQ